MSDVADAIVGTAADLWGPDAGVAETEDAQPVEAAVAAPEAEVVPEPEPEESWDFEAAGRDLFTDDDDDEPDFAAEASAEFDEAEDGEDVLAPSEYDDDTTKALKKQLAAEKKKAEYHARRHLETARKGWEKDVKGQPWGQFLPADLSTIKASSHREFLRAARGVARQNYEVLKPHYEKLAAEKARLRESATAEARAQAAQAWGKPQVGGGPGVPASADDGQIGQRLDEAIRRRSMVDVVKAMIDSGQV